MAFYGITVVQGNPLGKTSVHPLQLTSSKVIFLCGRSKRPVSASYRLW